MVSPPASTETILEMAADLQLDILLESPVTSDLTIRYICGARKSLLEMPQDQASPELVDAERLLTRLYHRIGYERRNLAFSRNRHPSVDI
jgi:hypothetical protein